MSRPPAQSLLQSSLVLLALSSCVPVPGNFTTRWNATEEERLQAALKKDDFDEVRKICIEPFFYEEGIFKRWTATESQDKACAALKTRWDAALARAVKEAQAAGGLGCVLILQGHYRGTSMNEKWTAKWETAEARRAAISPHAEPCIASLEALAKAGHHGALYLAIGREKYGTDGDGLQPDQLARVAAVRQGLYPNAATEYETAAAALKDEPVAAALFFAAAAVVAKEGGADERAAKNAGEAKAAVARAAVQERLEVSVSGDGLAAEVADRVRKSSPGPGLEFKAAAPLAFKVQLAAPTFSTGKETTTLSASYKVQKGTQTNPAFASKESDCKSAKHWHDEAVWSCNKNGARNANCPRIPDLRKKVESCEQALSRIARTVPGWGTEEVSYEGLRFFGSASGKLTVTEGVKPPAVQEFKATVSRVKHGGAPKANVSPMSASPVTEAELKDQYLSDAAELVLTQARALASGRAAGILASAKSATEPRAVAGNLVRYALVAKAAPSREVVDALGERLGVPAKTALEHLLGR